MSRNELRLRYELTAILGRKFLTKILNSLATNFWLTNKRQELTTNGKTWLIVTIRVSFCGSLIGGIKNKNWNVKSLCDIKK